MTLYPIHYRAEAKISGSFEIALAGSSQPRRANWSRVGQSGAE